MGRRHEGSFTPGMLNDQQNSILSTLRTMQWAPLRPACGQTKKPKHETNFRFIGFLVKLEDCGIHFLGKFSKDTGKVLGSEDGSDDVCFR